MVKLMPLNVLTTLPLFPPPEPEKDLDALLGEMFNASPKFTVPELLLILTAPTMDGKEKTSYAKTVSMAAHSFSLRRCRIFFTRASDVMVLLEPR